MLNVFCPVAEAQNMLLSFCGNQIADGHRENAARRLPHPFVFLSTMSGGGAAQRLQRAQLPINKLAIATKDLITDLAYFGCAEMKDVLCGQELVLDTDGCCKLPRIFNYSEPPAMVPASLPSKVPYRHGIGPKQLAVSARWLAGLFCRGLWMSPVLTLAKESQFAGHPRESVKGVVTCPPA
jgi:hypothetical protein